MNEQKHPSFGLVSPEEMTALKGAMIDYTYIKAKEEIKSRKPKPKKHKKPITQYMFSQETDGKNGKPA